MGMIQIRNILLAMIVWAIIIAGVVISINQALPAEIRHCDTSLVLAVDISGSVNAERFALQQNGLAAAFVNERVIKAVHAGPNHCINVTVFYWNSVEKTIVVPWTIISSVNDCINISQEIMANERGSMGATDLGYAIKFAIDLIQASTVLSDHLIIDVSGDGRDNQDMDATDINRNLAESFGITINGLPIINDEPDVVEWYTEHVRTSDGFIVPAKSFEDFGTAIINKLVQEIM